MEKVKEKMIFKTFDNYYKLGGKLYSYEDCFSKKDLNLLLEKDKITDEDIHNIQVLIKKFRKHKTYIIKPTTSDIIIKENNFKILMTPMRVFIELPITYKFEVLPKITDSDYTITDTSNTTFSAVFPSRFTILYVVEKKETKEKIYFVFYKNYLVLLNNKTRLPVRRIEKIPNAMTLKEIIEQEVMNTFNYRIKDEIDYITVKIAICILKKEIARDLYVLEDQIFRRTAR